MSDISLRLSRLNLSESAAQTKSEHVDDEFQSNWQHPLAPAVLATLMQRYGMDPLGPDSKLPTYQDLLDRNEVAVVPMPPYQESYGPYRELELDWFRFVIWSANIAGQRQWLYQFTFINDPITSSFDRTKEHIKIEAVGEDRMWYEVDPIQYILTPSAFHMRLTYPERRGVPEPTKCITLQFPPLPHIHQL